MKRNYIGPILFAALILVGVVLYYAFFDNSEFQTLLRRANADFTTNVLPSFPTVSKHQFHGYISTDERINGHIFQFELQDTSGISIIETRYRWIPESKEWGYVGWKKTNVSISNNAP